MTLPPHSEQTSREQLDHMLQEASTSCQNKQFEKAENEYQAILKIQADHPEANYSLGLLLLQKKQASASLSYFETALDKRPEYGPYWLTYIDALDQAGQSDVARQVFEMAQQAGLQGEDVDALKARLNINPKEATKQSESSVQLQATPTNPVSNSLPEQQDIDTLLSLYQDGRITECEQLALAILNCFPSHGLSWKVLGAALKRQERLEEAIIAMKQAALLLPQDHEALNNLGLTLKSQGNLSESETILRLALTLKEDFVEAHNNLGVTLMAQGRFAESEACFRQALHIQPEYVEAYCNLGINLKDQGRYADSEATFQHALQLRPSYAEVWSNLGNLLQRQERLSEAEASLRKALELNPDFAIAYNNLANTLQCQGHLEESVYCYHKALKLKPDYPEAYDGLLFVSNYHPDNSSEDLFQLYRDYDERFGLPHQEQWKPHSNTPNSNRRLKVGYVSPAFYSHPVLHFLEPLLACHDKNLFEIFAYSETIREDPITTRYQQQVDHWIPTIGLSDDALVEKIRSDSIDILVDLAGHTGRNRLGVFARKPTPISLHWLDYGYTTGLSAIDYYLTDVATAPIGSEKLFSEQLWRLPTPSLVYRPATDMGQVGPLPATQCGHVTFGTLTRAIRINHHTIRVWSEILHQVEGSRLIIDSGNFKDPTMRQSLVDKFIDQGIDKSRLEIGYHSPPWDVLRATDIGLDCFPHNSGTTLFENLYMGVPFITLANKPGIGRLGCMVLEGADHPEWIANTEDDYIKKAVALASNLPELASLRNSLRDDLQHSPLMDEQGFTKKVEDAYLEMFRQWRDTTEPRRNRNEHVSSAGKEKVIVADMATSHYNLGVDHQRQNQLAEAKNEYIQTINLRHNFIKAYNNLGVIFQQQGKFDEAKASFLKALEFKADYTDACYNLANTYKMEHELFDAEAAYRQVIAIAPNYTEAHFNLGNILQEQGRPQEAELSLHHALTLNPNHIKAFSTLLFALNYHPDKSAAEVFQAYQEFNTRFCQPHHDKWLAHTNIEAGNRRLKVAYVAPAYNKHPARYFVEPLLAHHDKGSMETYAYIERSQEEATTDLFHNYVDHWISTTELTDDQLSKQIRSDGIDILVDLAGHTAGNRLGVFARKPAPVSLHWLDFGYTTGLTAIDYYLTDQATVPAESEQFFSETPWRLNTPALAYRPPEDIGPVNNLPAEENGYLTFGTLTRAVRINHRTIRVWSEILKRCPGSRLIINSGSFREPSMQEAVAERFSVHGIERERLDIGSQSPPWNILRTIDITLDCFPHNSGTTLIESLYMGVPYITLADRPSVGRLGSSILEGVGHPEWIAKTEEEYIQKALILAGDLSKLAATRMTLRQDMTKSPLMNEQGFTEKVEAAYREMFKLWWNSRQITGQPLSEKKYAPLSTNRKQKKGTQKKKSKKNRKRAVPKSTEIDRLTQLFNQGNLTEATQLSRSLTSRFPQHGFGWKVLGPLLHQQGLKEEAIQAMQQATICLPDDPDTFYNLGIAQQQSDLLAEAANSYDKTLQLNKNHLQAQYNLGTVLKQLGWLAEAENCYRRALELKPDFFEVHCNLGNILRAQGRLNESIDSYRLALQIRPDSEEALTNLSLALRTQGILGEAETVCKQALQINPKLAEAHNNLGLIFQDQDRLTEAELYFQRALEIKPDYSNAHYNLGTTHIKQGRLVEAEGNLRRVIELQPESTNFYSALLFLLNNHPDKSSEEIYDAYKIFNSIFGSPLHTKWKPFTNNHKTNRRLKIGYVSSNFNKHSMRHFLEPLLAHHNKEKVEVYVYTDQTSEDAVTDRYRSYVDHWLTSIGINDDTLTEQIRGDGIDILIDLAGHTGGNRLGVFARKPAPVSLHWLDFGYTTGLTAIDYYLTDMATVPEGTENLFAETPWRIKTPSLAYRPAKGMGEVNSLPALERGYITFGTLTRALRINHRTIRVWSEILKRVEGAHLVIDSSNFKDESMQTTFANKFIAHGIDRDRLEIGYHSPPWDVLRGLDIGFDCFPHNSGTTLFETLYLGIPFVTLADRPCIGRLGSAILEGVGHPEWIASKEEEYIDIAVALASDLPRLITIRTSLREEMEHSPLMDEPAFARKVETAYNEMFMKWREEQQ
ncbi:MAG: tetratricopeptide repeat protein [Proteobacteria bacterium]|nr:tetratricopeptide repeat protein [Pseudomonadota bacterium]